MLIFYQLTGIDYYLIICI